MNQLVAKTDPKQRHFKSRMSVLKLERWAERINTDIEVFEASTPEFVDLADLVHGTASRSTFLRWEESLCDTEGCTRLVRPSVVAATMPLKDKSVPILALMDALEDAGWSLEER